MASDFDDEKRLIALREAIQVGIDDIEAGRYRIFKTLEEIEAYLKALTESVLGRER